MSQSSQGMYPAIELTDLLTCSTSIRRQLMSLEYARITAMVDGVDTGTISTFSLEAKQWIKLAKDFLADTECLMLCHSSFSDFDSLDVSSVVSGLIQRYSTCMNGLIYIENIFNQQIDSRQ